ncbi:hypothetical protein [Brevundimonas bacteroides]|uniref:hypothetical protein n=1 Tax=Brevundimonas bacteroides TaxID=74311 RepID=UPI0012EDF835|nr:hypothetical protein [Brevundimonas bacteroides]
MSADTDRVSLRMNILDGTIEIESSAGNFAHVADKAKEIAVATRLGNQDAVPPPRTQPANREEQITAPSAPKTESVAGEKRQKSNRTPGGSSGRPGRIGSFEPVKLDLSEDKERALREFVRDKAPVEQNHQVAVAMMKGEELLGRPGFDYNEIYTLMRLGGIKPLPKALDVVLGRMATDNWVAKEGKLFSMKFVGRDFVDENLPPKKGA